MLLNIFIILYINMTAKHLKKEQLDEIIAKAVDTKAKLDADTHEVNASGELVAK